MKRLLLRLFKGFIIGVIAIFLVTIGIDAADHFDNLSDTIIGRMIFNDNTALCPGDMVLVPAAPGSFCIDKYEASAGPGCPVPEPTSQTGTRENLDTGACQPASRAGAVPWRFISQTQAEMACAQAGKRLPTNEEWYLAALGTPDPESGWGPDDCQVDNNWYSHPGLTGSGKKCLSAAGAFDMSGNVWEWVKDEASDGMVGSRELPEAGYITEADSGGIPLVTDSGKPDPNFNEDYLWIKHDGVRGLARGGYWDNQADAGIFAVYLVAHPSFAGTGIGFRCVK